MKRFIVNWNDCEKILSVNISIAEYNWTDNGHAEAVFQATLKASPQGILDAGWNVSVWDFETAKDKELLERIWESNEDHNGITYHGSY